MRIAVVGCGAMGAIYAALLASSGHEVMVVCRRVEQVEAITRRGLRVQGASGDRTVALRALHGADSAGAGPVDLVVLAVKAMDVEAATLQAMPLLGPHTLVLAMQNGIGSAETVAGLVGAPRLVVGIATGFGASMQGPAHALHNAMKAVRFGAYAGLAPETVQALAQAWKEAGFDAAAVADIAAMQWEKLICNAAFSAPCALSGLRIGALMDDPALYAVSRAAAVEAFDVARALGVRLSVTDPVGHARAFGAQMPQAKPSALQDHEARRVSELGFINGAVPRFGVGAGVATPVNSTLMALVQARERAWMPVSSTVA